LWLVEHSEYDKRGIQSVSGLSDPAWRVWGGREMRRWAALVTVSIVLATTAGTADGAAASVRPASVPASSSRVGPGTVWVLWTGAACETETFGPHHTFTATGNDTGAANGDQGVYARGGRTGNRLTMTWTAGASAGAVFHARFSRDVDIYGGPDTVDGQTVVANLAPPSYRACPVVTSTLTAASTVYGSDDGVTVTVTGTGGVTPTGEVQFWACRDVAGPCDPNAVGATDLGTMTLSGAGDAATASTGFAPRTAGRYCFADGYGGDDHYRSIFTASDSLCFTVDQATSGVSAAPAQTQIVLGGSETDTATVTGAGGFTPTGTVAFYVCGPSPSPSSCTTTAGTEVGGPVDVGPTVGSPPSAAATSGAFTPTADGVYCFLAVYSGDAGYTPGSDGSASDQCFTVLSPATVTASPLTAAIVLGQSDPATATVVGENGITPTGTVHFFVCEDDPEECGPGTFGFADLGTAPLSGSGTTASATVAAYTPPTAGWYCFSAVYSGDADYAPASAATNTDDCFTVTSTAPPSSVPLGSPENSFGTGDLPLGVGRPTNVWAAVNGYCTSKENGDEFLSAFDATYSGGSTYDCPANPGDPRTPDATTNDEYDPSGYTYDIETPDQTPGGVVQSPLTVAAYDPSYNPRGCAGGGETPDNGIDGASTTITTTFSLYDAPVPSDPPSPSNLMTTYTAGTDDPASCGQWVTIGTIPAGAPDGTYQLQVATQAGQPDSDGTNAYGLEVYQGSAFQRCSTIPSVAWYSSSCPVIQGQSALSVYVDSPSTTGSFYLADIDSSHDGQTMAVNLFDPGEGDHYIQILDPNGNPVPFIWQTTDACPLPAPDQDSTDCAGGPGIAFPQTTIAGVSATGNFNGQNLSDVLDVSGTIQPPAGEESDSEFNDRHLQLAVTIPSGTAGWWQIVYYSDNSVTDRTTWTMSLAGTPTSSAEGSTTSGSPLLRAHDERVATGGRRPRRRSGRPVAGGQPMPGRTTWPGRLAVRTSPSFTMGTPFTMVQ